MLAEIFMVQLEATARVRQEAARTGGTRFVPFVRGNSFRFKDGEAHPAHGLVEATPEKAFPRQDARLPV